MRVSWSCHTFLSVSSLVNECANDAADDGCAEDGQAVRLVVFDVNDLVARGGRRWSGMPHGCRVVRRCWCAAMSDFMSVRRCFLMATTLCRLPGRGFLLLLGMSRTLATARSGSCQSRTANRNTRESRDCHLDYLLVHVTPTFPGFLPLHKVRRTGRRFLTQKIRFKLPIALPCRLEGAASDNNDSSLATS